jgi:capsular exopolysaccharide synthesis family protein
VPTLERSGVDIRHYLTVLNRRRWVIVVATCLVVAAAVAFSVLQTPVYQSHARVIIQQSQSLFQTSYGDYIDPARIQTEIEVIGGEAVQTSVRQRMGSAPGVTASVVGNTAVIDIAATSTVPAEAAKVATTYAETYIDYTRQRAVDSLLAATKQVQEKISDLDKQIADADARAAAARPANGAASLTPEQDGLRSQRAAFKEKVDQVQIDVALKNGGAELAAHGSVPTTPIRPTPVRNTLLGLLVGLIVGTALAFVADQLDDSLKTKDDLGRLAGDLPILGVIPKVAGWKNRGEPRVVSETEPSSPPAEAYRALRTSIQFFGVDRSMRTIQVTSPAAGDGKTTTVANLAMVLARAGQRVAVVSCDLRRPRIHEYFGLSNSVGFTSVLLGEVPLSGALQDVPGEDRIKLVASGPLPPNPSELLSSRRSAEVFRALKSQCDTVLIDCPPALPVTDAAVLSSQVDGTIVVVNAGITTGKQLTRAIELLRQVDAPLVGVVLNGEAPDETYDNKYGYAYQGHPATANGSGQPSSTRKSRGVTKGPTKRIGRTAEEPSTEVAGS